MPQLSVSQCIEHIKHTLGSRQVPAIGAMRILNDAGEFLCSDYPWAWLQGKRVLLDFESGQDHVWLPADFQELTGMELTNGITATIHPTSMQGLIDLRTRAIGDTNLVYWYSIAYAQDHALATGTITLTGLPADDSSITLNDGVNPYVEFEFTDITGSGASGSDAVAVDISAASTASDAAAALQGAIATRMGSGQFEIQATVSGAVVSLTSRIPGTAGNVTITDQGTTNATLVGMTGGEDGGYPRPRLDIWPDPGADDDGAITAYYRAGFETLDEDGHFVSIPIWLQALYLQLVRAFTRGYEREDMASLSARCMEVMMGPLATAAKRRDGMAQPEYGELRNGAAEMQQAGFYPYRYFDTVADPTT